MRKDQIIIITCVLLAVGLLSAAASLMPRINHTRADLQLTVHDDVLENLPPNIALTQAALGSFRGLAVDVLWGRVRTMQERGELYEAMQLADWITQLQPRFAQVWVFHAWNMAYNISATTATPEERWMWVTAGIELLRDEGIPLNPNSVELYRELGRIYQHKIGQYSDNMHWYYKEALAAEWHEVLGEPPADAEAVLEWFEPIAQMYELYVNERELGYAVREELERLAEDSTTVELARDFSVMTLQQLDTRLLTLHRRGGEVAERLAPLRELVREQRARAQRTAVHRIRAADSEVANQLDRLREQGLRPNRELLRQLAEVRIHRDSRDLGLREFDESDLDETEQWLLAWMDDEEIADARERVLAFTRARVLHEDYRMSPLWMYELKKGDWFAQDGDEQIRVPLDWRHPASHGVYWSSMGVRRNRTLLQAQDFQALNTDRQVIHSLQDLMRTGNLIFDPATRAYRVLPDPRFIDAYHVAVFGAYDRVSGIYVHSDAPDTFRSGHENFLTQAVQLAYFYGEESQARRYYGMLREDYSDFRSGRDYSQPLDEFVLHNMIEQEIHSLDDALAIVTGWVHRAIDQGLVSGDRDLFNRYLSHARRTHQFYNDRRESYAQTGQAGNVQRLMLPEFNDVVANTFMRFLTSPTGGEQVAMMKSRAWRASPSALQLRVFDHVRDQLYADTRQQGFDAERMFPAPEGLAAYRERRGEQPPPTADLIEQTPERN